MGGGQPEPDAQEQIKRLVAEVERLQTAGELEDALETASRLVDLSRAPRALDHEVRIAALRTLVSLYEEVSNYEAALSCHLQLLPALRDALGDRHPDVATTLHDIAFMYDVMGDYQTAIAYYKEALELQRQVLGQYHADTARTLNNLAMVYGDLDDLPTAQTLHNEALEIKRNLYGNHHPDVALSLNNLAGIHKHMDDYSTAEKLYTEAAEIDRETLGANHPEYATDLNNLATLYYEQEQYGKAIQYYELALNIRQAALGANHSDVAQSLVNLGITYEALGRYDEAIGAYERALGIRRQLPGDNGSAVAQTLNNLAVLYMSVGEFGKALSYCQQALPMQREALGTEHPDYAKSLNNLAWLYQEIGNYGAAEELYVQALDILHSDPGPEHVDFATGLNNLGLLYEATTRYNDAETLLQQALKIRRMALGDWHPDVGTNLTNLGNVYRSQGRYSGAETLYLEAAEVDRKALGEEHPLYATDLNNLGLLYCDMGKYQEAEDLLRKATGIWRATLGETHPDLSAALGNLAAVLVATGRPHEAVTFLREQAAVDEGLIGLVFGAASDWQRLSLLDTLKTNLYTFMSFAIQYAATLEGSAEECFALVLRRKGLGAEVLAVQRDAMLAGHYPALEVDIRALVSLRKDIARRATEGPGDEDPSTYRAQQSILEEQRERLEAILASQIPEMNMSNQLRKVDPHSVAAKLDKETALVEFILWSERHFGGVPARGEQTWSAPRYAAFVLHATPEYSLQIVDLGDAGTIDDLVGNLRSEIVGVESTRSVRDRPVAGTSWGAESFLAAGRALYNAIFSPLLPALGECRRIFVAPDGELARVPFQVLPLDRERYLIDDYHISYLSTGRELLSRPVSLMGRAGVPLVAADPNFNLSEAAPEEVTSDSKQQNEWRRTAYGQRYFADLPGTRAEGEQIAGLLGVEPLLRDAVLKSKLKECHSPFILHLATHGFFLPDPEYEPVRNTGRWRAGGPATELLTLVNPLLRSALALAGANTWLRGGVPPPEAEDGLLTAEDISGMDLVRTQLVVLSACDTGLGHIHTGEGVFGLRRAFRIAGARTLVISLWRIPDLPTNELMMSFYQPVLQGQGCADALRDAQLALRTKYPNPLYWAAFICEGDPGPIT